MERYIKKVTAVFRWKIGGKKSLYSATLGATLSDNTFLYNTKKWKKGEWTFSSTEKFCHFNHYISCDKYILSQAFQ